MDKSPAICDNLGVLGEGIPMNTCYAHSRPGAPIEKWQTLQAHSKAVSCLSPCHSARLIVITRIDLSFQ